jgi:hypothetical protein
MTAERGTMERMRRGGRWLALIPAILIAVVAVAGAEPDAKAELRQAREVLLERASEYRASLTRMLELQEGAARRAADVAGERQDQLAAGIVSRREAEQSVRQRDDARALAEETRRRLADVETVLAETRAAIELAALPPPRTDEIVATTSVIRYAGGAAAAIPDLSQLQTFFAARFGRPLPVSALGQTPLHDRLGFDHRRAVDVAVHPDSEEGRALMAFLRERHVPFMAFREAVPGASTGAHVHIGTPSDHIVPVRWSPR